jgi:hypothetical protein
VIDAFEDTIDLARDFRQKLATLSLYFFESERQLPVDLARRGPGHFVNQGMEAIGLPDQPTAFEFVPDCVNDRRKLIAAR